MKKKLSHEKKRTGRGFTLIELLVVISIIAILLSIMIPSLSRVRESSRNTVCKTNFRQISLGIYAYAQNNKEYLPLHCARGNWWSPPPNPKFPHLMWFDLLPPYQISAANGVLYCPSDRHRIKPSDAMIGPIPPGTPMPQGDYRAPHNNGWISYRYNVRFTRRGIFNDPSYYPQRLTEFKFPNRSLVIADGVSIKGMIEQSIKLPGGYDFALEASWNYIGNRHNRGKLYLFNGLLADMSINTWDQNVDLLREFNWSSTR